MQSVEDGAYVTMPEPSVKAEDFLYWKDNSGKMYQPGEAAVINADTELVAVYPYVYNFIDDEENTSDYTTQSTAINNIFSNSSAGTSYLLDDGNGNYTGGVHFEGTVGSVAIGNSGWKHKVFIYDPDSDLGDANGYLQIKKNTIYEVTVTYKNNAANSAIGIGVSSNASVGMSTCNALAASAVSTAADTEWQTLTCTIDGNGQANTSPDGGTQTMTDLAGRYIALIAGTNSTNVDIKEVVITAYTRADSEVFAYKYVNGDKTVEGMTPGEPLLPASNVNGEASLGWYDPATGAKVSTAPSTDFTVYAKYPSVVYDFEAGSTDRFLPSTATSVGTNSITVVSDPATGAAQGNVLRLETNAQKTTSHLSLLDAPSVGTDGYKLEAGKRYRVSLKVYIADAEDNHVRETTNRIVLYTKSNLTISNDGHTNSINNNGLGAIGTDGAYAYDTWNTMSYEWTQGEDKHSCTDDACTGSCYLSIGFASSQSMADTTKGYKVIVYYDDITITEISDETEPYRNPVEDAKSSLRKAVAETNVTAGLRFRAELKGAEVDAASEIGFVAIPAKLVTDANAAWYKLDGADTSAAQGKLTSGAAYVKIANFKDASSYYAYDQTTGNYQYQLCITGMSDSSKQAEFIAVVYIKTGDSFVYRYVNSTSYNTIKAVYESFGITGY